MTCKMPKSDNIKLEIGIVFLITITIIILVLLFIFRYELFGANIDENSTSDTALSQNFGYYSNPTTSPCISSDGLCSSPATQYTVRVCKPNPINGRGCLFGDGRIQTYKSLLTEVSCIPQCYVGIWESSNEKGCKVDNFDTCIERGTVGYKELTLECKAKDNSGINSCVIPVPTGTQSGEIIESGVYPLIDLSTKPQTLPGCTINSRNIASCLPGVKIRTTTECVPDISLYPFCGYWGVINGDDIALTLPCETTIDFDTTQNCNSFITRKTMSNITDLFTLGYYLQPTKCVENIGLYSSEGVACVTGNCESSSTSILESFDTQSSREQVYTCFDNTVIPSCLKTCFFYDFTTLSQITGSVFEDWKDIIGIPLYLSISGYDITLNHVPCAMNSDGGYLENSPTLNTSTLNTSEQAMAPLSDCYGNPENTLNTVPLIVYDPSFISQNTTDMGLPTCSKENIRNSTSTIFIFKPLSVVDDKLKCNIIGIQAAGYFGFLKYNSDKELHWKEASYAELAGGTSSDNIIFYVSKLTSNKFSIESMEGNILKILNSTSTLDLDSVTPLNIETAVEMKDIYGEIFTMNPVKFNSENTTDSFPNFHTLLNYRATRHNPFTCNAYYSYPPPPNYREYDVGLNSYEDESGKIWRISTYSDVEVP